MKVVLPSQLEEKFKLFISSRNTDIECYSYIDKNKNNKRNVLADFILELILNKYVRFIFYRMEEIGLKKNRCFVYEKNLELENKASVSDFVSLRICTEKDIKKISERVDTSCFLKNLNNGHIMIGAFIDENIVGFIWISFKKIYLPEIKGWGEFNGVYIWNLYVYPKYRKKGVGTALLIYALSIASDKFKAKKAYVIIDNCNIISQKLFESLSFKKICMLRVT